MAETPVPIDAATEANLSGLLSRASGLSIKIFGTHVLILFVVFSVNLNIDRDWADRYVHAERSALVVLDTVYPPGDKAAEARPYDTSANAHKQQLIAAVAKDPKSPAKRYLSTWEEGSNYIYTYYLPNFNLDNVSERNLVHQTLTDDLKEHMTEAAQAVHFQLPFLNQSFDGNDRVFVLGVALFISSVMLLLAVAREYGVVKAIEASCGDAVDCGLVRRLGTQQYVYVSRLDRTGLGDVLRTIGAVLFLAAVLVPAFIQFYMCRSQEFDPWLAVVSADMYQEALGVGKVLIYAIAVVALVLVWTYFAIWRCWQRMDGDGAVGKSVSR